MYVNIESVQYIRRRSGNVIRVVGHARNGVRITNDLDNLPYMSW
jgi:hypothetical protein